MSSSFNKLKEQEREARKNIIIEAAIKQFSRNPLSSVGMRDIAKEAGISPALIYRYFSDRDELFIEVFFIKSQELMDNFKDSLSPNQTTIESLAINFVTYLLDNDLFFRMMTYFMMDSGIKLDSTERFNLLVRELLKHFDDIFISGGVAEKQARLYSHAFFASLNGVMITFRNYPGRSEDEVRKHVHRLATLIGNLFSSQVKQSPQ